MRTTDRRRRVGGVAAVVAAFWLGFVCGSGGTLPEAAALGEPSGQPPREPSPASQPPGEPAPVPDGPSPASQPPGEPAPVPDGPSPASQPPGEPSPASQPPGEPSPAPDETVPADAVPEEESAPADPAPEGSVQEDPETEASTGPEPPVVQDRPREFTARTGIVLYFVRPDAESAFEGTLARVAEAFAASESEEREQQADGWSTYRAEEALADGGLLYVSWVDPAIPGVDYWIPGILNEAFPTEAQSLYETYAGAFADGQILLNLIPVAGP